MTEKAANKPEISEAVMALAETYRKASASKQFGEWLTEFRAGAYRRDSPYRKLVERLEEQGAAGDDTSVAAMAIHGKFEKPEGLLVVTGSYLLIYEEIDPENNWVSHSLSEIQAAKATGIFTPRIEIHRRNKPLLTYKLGAHGPHMPALAQALLTATPAVARSTQANESAGSSSQDFQEELAKAVRTFNVHALGPRGSGKTVFMAAMFANLRLRRNDLVFYLQTDPSNSARLAGIYHDIASPSGEWPESTRDVREHLFDVCVPTQTSTYVPVRLKYLDYPGGVLADPRGYEDRTIIELRSKLEAAHALLILLDGQEIRALLEEAPSGERYLDYELMTSLEIAQLARRPIHFVITKWDLLEGQYSLEAVRDRLLQSPMFERVIAAKAEDGTAAVRLIPVSAVGAGFAEPVAGGGMRKRGRAPRAVHLEIPVLAVIPDFLDHAVEALNQRIAALREEERRNTAGIDSKNKQSSLVASLTAAAMVTVRTALLRRWPSLSLLLNDVVFSDAVTWAQTTASRGRGRNEAQRAADLQQVLALRATTESQESALRLLQEQASLLLDQFTARNPGSILVEARPAAGGLGTPASRGQP